MIHRHTELSWTCLLGHAQKSFSAVVSQKWKFWVIMFTHLQLRTVKSFSKVVAPIHSSTNKPHIQLKLLQVLRGGLLQSVECEMVFHSCLNLHFPGSIWCGTSFHILIYHQYIFSTEASLKVCGPVFNWVVFLWLNYILFFLIKWLCLCCFHNSCPWFTG